MIARCSIRAILFAAILLCLIGGASASQKIRRPMRHVSVPARLKPIEKAAILKQLGINVPPTGITDKVELTVQKPFVDGQAWVDFNGFYQSSVVENTISGLGPVDSPPPYNLGANVTLTLKVVEPNKPHLILFYVNSDMAQQFKVDGISPTITANVTQGPSVISALLIPSKVGTYFVRLYASKYGYTFTRAEVSVVN